MRRRPHIAISDEPRPLVALVGRPNVGKSTLFNRLVGGHHAIVEDQPGVTRDRRYGDAEWDGREFRVVDTGGLDFTARKSGGPTVARGVLDQALKAVEEADVLVFVVDAKVGISGEDRDAAAEIRKFGKPVLWVANKVDSSGREADAQELYSIGADQVIAVSAQHGRNIGELCDAIIARLPEAPETAEPSETAVDELTAEERQTADRPIRVALVGRPNAGKSSLINRFMGEDRMLVDAEAGTTRDPVDTPFHQGDRRYILIDTAGIRRRSKVYVPMEKIAVAMAEKAVNRADVCVLVVDAEGGLAEQEAKIAGLVDAARRALVICFNKVDLTDGDARAKLRENVERQLQFVPWAKIVFCSAKTGKGVLGILDAVDEAYAAFAKRVTTGQLNRWFGGIVQKHPPSLYRGHPVQLYFIQQPETHPPTFVLSVNAPEGIHFSYRRFLINQLRQEFKLDGTPIRLICKARNKKKKR